jgi:hypothetical protein
MGYCTALIMNALGLLDLCGERMSTRSDGCGKPGHQFRDGVNRWLKDGLDGRVPVMPDLPHVILAEMFEQWQAFLKTGEFVEVKEEQDTTKEGDNNVEGPTEDNDTTQDIIEEDGELEWAPGMQPWDQYNTKPESYREKKPTQPKEKTKAKKFTTAKLVSRFQDSQEKRDKKAGANGESKKEEPPIIVTRIPGSDIPTLRFLTNVYLVSHSLAKPETLPSRQSSAPTIVAKTLKLTKTRRTMAANPTLVAESRFAQYTDSARRQLQMERFNQLYTESLEKAAKQEVITPIIAGNGRSKAKSTYGAATTIGKKRRGA